MPVNHITLITHGRPAYTRILPSGGVPVLQIERSAVQTEQHVLCADASCADVSNAVGAAEIAVHCFPCAKVPE